MFEVKNYIPKNEKELHDFIERKIEDMEEGLKILKYEMEISPQKKIDFLCVDKNLRLVVIEVKLKEDNAVLWQAMEYYNELEKKRYNMVSMFKDHQIDANKDPKIILIASKFSSDIRRMCNHVSPDVDLYTYHVLENEEKKLAIIFTKQDQPQIETIREIPKLVNHRNILSKNELKPIFDKVRADIRKIDENNLKEYVTKSYVAYSYRNRIVCGIITRKSFFYIFINSWNENFTRLLDDYTNITIECESDNYDVAIKKIKQSLLEIKEFYSN